MAWLDLDGRLYRNRSFVTLVFAVVIVFQLITLALSLLGVPWYPSQVLGHHTVPLSIMNHVELLLTTGTLALAFAAVVQAVAAEAQASQARALTAAAEAQAEWAKAEAVSVEKRREADLTPHLFLTIMEGRSESDIRDGTAVSREEFSIDTDQDTIAFELRNLGPGQALDVEVRTIEWSTPVFQAGGEPTELITNPLPGGVLAPVIQPTALSNELINVPYALTVRDKFPFSLKIAAHSPSGPPGSGPPFHTYRTQLVILARARCVDGDRVSVDVIGLRLQQLYPKTIPAGPGATRGYYESRWRRIPPEDIGPIIRVSPFPPYRQREAVSIV